MRSMLQGKERERMRGVGESRWEGEGNRAKPKNNQPKKDGILAVSFRMGEISKALGNCKYFNLQQLSEVNTMTEFTEVLQSA